MNTKDLDYKKLTIQEAELIDAKNDLEITSRTLAYYQNYTLELLELVNSLKKQLEEVYSSTRWKITQPLWKLKNAFSHGEGHNAPAAQSRQNPSEAPVSAADYFNENKSRNILIIDRQIPCPDKDAGSRSIFQYMQLLCKMGFTVKLIADENNGNQNYIQKLNGIGVGLASAGIDSAWKKFISDNGKNIGFIVLNRPNVALKYIDFLNKNTQAKIIYFGCDLHYLREMREYQLSGDAAVFDSANRIKVKEFIAIGKADITVMYSEYEKEIIQKEFGKTNVIAAPVYYFDEYKINRKEFKDTKDILFVGGFSHKPNIDGLLWFMKDIWTEVKKQLPDASLIVVGSNPTEEICAITDERVKVMGFVPDDDLQRIYSECRLCVIPLRFGAGIKGKTIEAIKNGIPVVSTSVGIEGINGIEQYITPADTPEGFAQQVVSVYQDETISKEIGRNYKTYMQQNFSRQKLEEKLQEIFQ